MSMRVMLRKQEALLDKLVALAGSAVRVEEVILALHRELGDSPTLRQVIRRILERRHATGADMSETKQKRVYGVWNGQEEAWLEALFTTRRAAQQYADDYNRDECERMNARFAALAARAEAEGRLDRATRYREQTWEPQCYVRLHTVFTTPESADPRLYKRLKEPT